MTTFGIIGAGNIGSALARGLADRGHEVLISNSRGPETLADLVADIGGGARAATVQDAATAGEVVIVTVPLKALGDVPVEPLAGKIVLDTNNYYWERDGHIEALDQNQTTTTRLVQEHLPTSKVAKAFNHILSSQILTDGTPAGTTGRRALATASDHPEAIAFVTDLYDAFGYDSVDVGSVDDSWRIERDQPGYGAPKSTTETLREALARADR
ncbi:NAD(P)-binding domain-containing protein [Microbacterium lacus]|uniref:NADPH-dependent F420 reductase n=1 Tax=Microbacterium lacus TaxID=415217 RepID=UPI00384F341D